MDAWELSEDMLDAIARERDACLQRQADAQAKLNALNSKDNPREVAELSAEVNRHMEAAAAVRRALDAAQKIKDEAVADLQEED